MKQRRHVPDNVDSMQTHPSADFIWLFYQYLYKRNTLNSLLPVRAPWAGQKRKKKKKKKNGSGHNAFPTHSRPLHDVTARHIPAQSDRGHHVVAFSRISLIDCEETGPEWDTGVRVCHLFLYSPNLLLPNNGSTELELLVFRTTSFSSISLRPSCVVPQLAHDAAVPQVCVDRDATW